MLPSTLGLLGSVCVLPQDLGGFLDPIPASLAWGAGNCHPSGPDDTVQVGAWGEVAHHHSGSSWAPSSWSAPDGSLGHTWLWSCSAPGCGWLAVPFIPQPHLGKIQHRFLLGKCPAAASSSPPCGSLVNVPSSPAQGGQAHPMLQPPSRPHPIVTLSCYPTPSPRGSRLQAQPLGMEPQTRPACVTFSQRAIKGLLVEYSFVTCIFDATCMFLTCGPGDPGTWVGLAHPTRGTGLLSLPMHMRLLPFFI